VDISEVSAEHVLNEILDPILVENDPMPFFGSMPIDTSTRFVFEAERRETKHLKYRYKVQIGKVPVNEAFLDVSIDNETRKLVGWVSRLPNGIFQAQSPTLGERVAYRISIEKAEAKLGMRDLGYLSGSTLYVFDERADEGFGAWVLAYSFLTEQVSIPEYRYRILADANTGRLIRSYPANTPEDRSFEP